MAGELADQPRLAETGLGDDRDELGRGSGSGAIEELGEHRQLEIAADERGAVTLLGADPGDGMQRPPCLDRFCLALGRDRSELLVDDRLLRSPDACLRPRPPPSRERRPRDVRRCSSCPRSRTPRPSEDRRRDGRAPPRCSPRSGPRCRGRRLRCLRMIRSAARTARSGSSSWASGTPNTPTTASPMNFSTTPPWDSIRLPADRLVVAEQTGDVFGVQALPQRGGADEVAEQSGDDLALLADRGRFELGAAFAAELLPFGVLRAAGRAGRAWARAYVGCANRLKGTRCYARRHWPTTASIAHASDQRKWWALRVSNPRPSPCKGEEEVLVRGLSRTNECHKRPSQSLGVEPARYADVVPPASPDLSAPRPIHLVRVGKLASLPVRLPHSRFMALLTAHQYVALSWRKVEIARRHLIELEKGLLAAQADEPPDPTDSRAALEGHADGCVVQAYAAFDAFACAVATHFDLDHPGYASFRNITDRLPGGCLQEHLSPPRPGGSSSPSRRRCTTCTGVRCPSTGESRAIEESSASAPRSTSMMASSSA